MPTILRKGPYRFFFYAGDREEPFHIHVEHDDNTAKFWLDPVRIQYSHGFNSTEIRHIQKLINDNQKHLIGKWNEYFND